MAKIKASSQGVKVTGLSELNKALRAMGGKEFQKELREASKDVAGFVAEDAKSNAYSLGGVAAKVAPSIGASAGFTSAGVRFGGSAYPMSGGAEFGSLAFKQFKTWRGNGSNAGYFVYPAIRENADEIAERYLGAADAIIQKYDL